jgi:hypothetical protein
LTLEKPYVREPFEAEPAEASNPLLKNHPNSTTFVYECDCSVNFHITAYDVEVTPTSCQSRVIHVKVSCQGQATSNSCQRQSCDNLRSKNSPSKHIVLWYPKSHSAVQLASSAACANMSVPEQQLPTRSGAEAFLMANVRRLLCKSLGNEFTSVEMEFRKKRGLRIGPMAPATTWDESETTSHYRL